MVRRLLMFGGSTHNRAASTDRDASLRWPSSSTSAAGAAAPRRARELAAGCRRVRCERRRPLDSARRTCTSRCGFFGEVSRTSELTARSPSSSRLAWQIAPFELTLAGCRRLPAVRSRRDSLARRLTTEPRHGGDASRAGALAWCRLGFEAERRPYSSPRHARPGQGIGRLGRGGRAQSPRSAWRRSRPAAASQAHHALPEPPLAARCDGTSRSLRVPLR